MFDNSFNFNDGENEPSFEDINDNNNQGEFGQDSFQENREKDIGFGFGCSFTS